jgi:hypothetical protein
VAFKLLDEMFAAHEHDLFSRLQERVRWLGSDEKSIQHLCEHSLHTAVDGFASETRRYFLEMLQGWRKRLEHVRKELTDQRALRAQLEEDRRRAILQGVESPPSRSMTSLYFVLYVILVITAMGICVFRFTHLFPDQAFWVSVGSTVFALAPSFLFTNKYRSDSSADRKKLITWLNRVDIGYAASAVGCITIVGSIDQSR